MQQTDPFNWPFPQRTDLMSMSKIPNEEAAGYQQRKTRAISQDYKYSEPQRPTYFNKVSYANRCDDIEGTRPQTLLQNQPVTRPILNMKLEDIQGTRPQVCKFQTNRISNPLEPTYHLATALPAPVGPPPRFVRDTMNVRDIEGTKPKKDPWYNKIRNVDPYTEIEGSKSRPTRVLRDHSNKLDVSDINGKVMPSKRETDPLEPRYNLRGSSYGYVEGSRPTVAHPDRNKEKSLSLNTDQIKGCKSDTVRENFYMREIRKYFPEPNKVDDIAGTKVGTRIRGLKTNRFTNPLNPSYDLPGLK